MAAFHCTISLMLLFLPPSIRKSDKVEKQFRLSDVLPTMKGLFANKILMADTLSLTFYLFARSNSSYLNKFVEFQFHMTPSEASLFSGTTRMGAMMIGLLVSTVIITWFKPSARFLALFNFLADILVVIVGFSLMFIDCPSSPIVGPDSCSDSCQCSLTYSPVCDQTSGQTFFSPCSAGCSTIGPNSTFTDCSCSGPVTSGYCPQDCHTPLMYYLISEFALYFLVALGKVGNLVIHLRCVEPEDKALGMALQEMFIALFAFIPAELLFGALMDSACTIWMDLGCGATGNCLTYDTDDLRYKLFGVAALANGLAALCDGIVWYEAKKMKRIYD